MKNPLPASPIDLKTALHALEITAMYKVAFNRLPDAEGLQYWLNDMAHGQTLDDVARSFGTHMPQFGDLTTKNIINQLSVNAFGHEASLDVINHWGVMAINAVPSYVLMEQMALQLVGQQVADWAYPVL